MGNSHRKTCDVTAGLDDAGFDHPDNDTDFDGHNRFAIAEEDTRVRNLQVRVVGNLAPAVRLALVCIAEPVWRVAFRFLNPASVACVFFLIEMPNCFTPAQAR